MTDHILDEPTGHDLNDGSADRADDVLSDEEFADALEFDADSSEQWPGDRGDLDRKQRDTLVALVKKAFISSDDKVAWSTLMRDPGPIVRSLNNLYFNLVVDDRAEVAYATPARSADNPFKTLVRDTANNREETLLLVYLRERHRAETASGLQIVHADADAMLDYVSRFRPPSATDVVGDERRVRSAIDGLVSSGLLVRTPDADRYRVHRAIEALLPLPLLHQLVDAFRAQNDGTTTVDPDELVDDTATADAGTDDGGPGAEADTAEGDGEVA